MQLMSPMLNKTTIQTERVKSKLDSMPAQQSASAEDDEEEQIKEIPRQSVLQGILSTFENDQEVQFPRKKEPKKE